MVKCAIESCKNDSRKQNKEISCVTFHRFPKKPSVMEKWVSAVRIMRKDANWEPNIWTKICSEHFKDSDFYGTRNGLQRLTNDAVPSFFHKESPATSKSNKVVPITNSDTPRVSKLKKEIIRLEDIAKRRRMRCKALSAANQRLKKKVNHIVQILIELKSKILINQEQDDRPEVYGPSESAMFYLMNNKRTAYPSELYTLGHPNANATTIYSSLSSSCSCKQLASSRRRSM